MAIMRCTCEHEFQDKCYGKYMRVHTVTKKEIGGKIQFRCTVCGEMK